MLVYLDNNATTTMPDEVVEAMLPYLKMTVGNPSSVHRFGRMSRQAIDQARLQVASLVNAEPSQVVFTSGGTEANNLAIQGSCYSFEPARLSISAVEHPSVIEPAKLMAARGWALDVIGVSENGQVMPETLHNTLFDDTRLVSVMMANNETGVVQDIETIGQCVRDKGIWFHSDVSQAAGKINVDIKKISAHLMTLSSHKMYGPRGAGALIIDKSIEITPLLVGGGQEKNLRSGTENIAAIVGFGMAAELAKAQLASRNQQLLELQRQLEQGLGQIDSVTIFAEHAPRLPNTTLFAVRGIEGETLLMQLDRKGYAVSSGSACHSSKIEASHVLKAMGVTDSIGSGAIRVSLGIQNTAAEINGFLQALQEVLATLQPANRTVVG